MRKGSARDCGAMDDSVSNQEMLRQLDRGPLLRTIWKRVLDATERAGPRIVERRSIKFSADYYEAKDREEGRNGPLWVSCTIDSPSFA